MSITTARFVIAAVLGVAERGSDPAAAFAPPPSSPGAAVPLVHPALLVLIALGLVVVARRYIARR